MHSFLLWVFIQSLYKVDKLRFCPSCRKISVTLTKFQCCLPGYVNSGLFLLFWLFLCPSFTHKLGYQLSRSQLITFNAAGHLAILCVCWRWNKVKLQLAVLIWFFSFVSTSQQPVWNGPPDLSAWTLVSCVALWVVTHNSPPQVPTCPCWQIMNPPVCGCLLCWGFFNKAH